MAKTGQGGAVGVVCRSETGMFLGASTLTVDGIVSPTVMEALACREGLALAQDLNIQKVMVATDCLTVVNDMARPFVGSYCMVIDEIKASANQFATLRLGMRIEHPMPKPIG
jgi:ribonuclease HI